MAVLIANPPSIAPHPNFMNLCNLRHHIQCTLQRVNWPQSNIFGWVGRIMSRAVYSLLTTPPFWLPTDPGPLAVYFPPPVQIVDDTENPVFDAAGMPTYHNQATIDRATQATINACFKRAEIYWKLYMNIQRAVFNCLDDNICDVFKALNNPAFVGRIPSMEPWEIFNQITATCRGPTPAALLQNDTLFWCVYSPQDAPEVLFCWIKDCQEVQILGEDPYMAQQLLNNAAHLLLQYRLYTCDFEDWDCKTAPDKIWINLKMFVQECYMHCLNVGEHHLRCTWVCAERICGPSQRIQGGRWWCAEGHHADGCINYTESTYSNYGSRNFSIHCSSDQPSRSKPNCHVTTVCCIHRTTQHNLPAGANSRAPHYTVFYP